MTTIDNSYASKRSNSIFHKKNLLIAKFPNLFIFFEKKTPDDIKLLYKKFRLRLLLIDIFNTIADLIVVTWLYFNHFEYNKHGYKPNRSDNIQRGICLAISVLVIISIIFRYFTKKSFQNIKYLLSMRGTLPPQNIKILFLIIEIFIHCIQPYPGVKYNFSMIILGSYVTYSLDMILFSLSLIRLYVVLKVIKVWNTYTNSRGHKIFAFFGNKEIWFYLYRTNLKNMGFITVSCIFIIISFVCGYIFKVFENYQKFENQSIFGSIWNCLWFLLQTMTTIGFGEYVPDTLVGRVIAIVLCFAGIFLQSLFTVSLLMFISLVDEHEQKAYAEINLLYAKEKQNNSYNIFFNNFIKYKFRKLIPKRKNDFFNRVQNTNVELNNKPYINKQIALRSFQRSLNQVFSMKVIKEQYYLRVMASLKIPLTLSDFCFFVKDQWEPQTEDTLEWYKERNDTYKQFNDFMCNSIQHYFQSGIKLLFQTNQMVNLAYLLFFCGPLFPIETYKNIKSDTVVTKKKFETRMKEFHIIYYTKKLNYNKNFDNSFEGMSLMDKDEELKSQRSFSYESELVSRRDDESYYSEGNSFIEGGYTERGD